VLIKIIKAEEGYEVGEIIDLPIPDALLLIQKEIAVDAEDEPEIKAESPSRHKKKK